MIGGEAKCFNGRGRRKRMNERSGPALGAVDSVGKAAFWPETERWNQID